MHLRLPDPMPFALSQHPPPESHAVGMIPDDFRLHPLGFRILDQLSIGIVVTREDNVVYCNRAFESMAGLLCAHIEGLPHPFLEENRVPADNRAELCRILGSGPPDDATRVRFERDDGFPTWNEVQIFRDNGHTIWMHRDITQQMATHELWQRYAFLVDSSRQFMALVNRDHKYELVNESFAQLFDVTPDEIHGSSGETIWGSALFKTIVAPNLNRCFQGEEVQLHCWVTLPGGSRRFLNMVYTPYRAREGGVQHAVFVAWDNTEEKIATDTVSELNKILEQRVDERTAELRDTMRELEAFNYTIAHDLRSPLRFLKSFTHMLEEEAADKLGDEGLHYCEMIAKGVAEMQHLIDRLLDFSRLSKKPVAMTACDLNAIVASARDSILLDDSTAVEIGPLPYCLGDPSLLKQVFVNLLGNAFKFTREADLPTITVIAEDAGEGTVQVCVRDNGVGFHMNHADAMFAPFKQVHEGSFSQGSGLGLAIVRRIVERHGGAVWAEGVEGEGAWIHVRLMASPHGNEMVDTDTEEE